MVRFVRPWKARSKTIDAGALRRGARDLHGVLDRLRAGVDEQRLRRRVAGPVVVEPPRHLDVRLVDPDHEALVEVAVGLLVDRADDARRAVAEVLAGDAAAEVEVLAPVGVPDLRAPRLGHDELGRGDAARHVPLACLDHPLRGGVFVDRHPVGGLFLAALHVFNSVSLSHCEARAGRRLSKCAAGRRCATERAWRRTAPSGCRRAGRRPRNARSGSASRPRRRSPERG